MSIVLLRAIGVFALTVLSACQPAIAEPAPTDNTTATRKAESVESKQSARKQPVLEIKGRTLSFNGTPLVFGKSLENWTAALGENFWEEPGSSGKGGRTWDALGLTVYLARENHEVNGRLLSRPVNKVIAADIMLSPDQQPQIEGQSQVPRRRTQAPGRA